MTDNTNKEAPTIRLNAKISNIFKLIVEMFIETGEPVASKRLVEKYNLDWSSASIRSMMAELEKNGFLEKQHTSGGRIPSTFGLEYYSKYLVYDNEEYFTTKLDDLLAKRRISIDSTLDEAARVISEMAAFTVVATTNNQSETLKNITLTVLNETSAVIVLITSSGNVQNKIFYFEKDIELKDLRVAVRLFKERLIDTPLIELAKKAETLVPIFSDQVKNFELILQKFVKSIFVFEEKIESKAFNKNAIILSKNISREEIANLLELIENHSIWEAIENSLDEENNIKLDYSRPNMCLISKKIDYTNNENVKEISILGPKNIDVRKSFEALTILEKIIKEKNDGFNGGKKWN
ncbi:heat-inducible transcriptional repressor HrcA [[Mycoplasma] falconis]|uniref:Heat-inducible transcription repressor HrcA n=1 Tax=[Mycoplasma] falconis TaxID=92403 RepID=A0A501X8L3_9BACT|nr:heat-inducible transcriptional repressor HrcA [[Mycoplasma] falconis]TPE56759.1 heat-inducible transcriptional repressor HrcA [[Mycoplasma] falconis]